ncbi:MAG: ABC transporter ATP-binding protein [Verrucomicrobia bacterium]|nr:ABC transporter ATP-binding protein [Verrucomicrobiota bacterium]MCF7707428.1 ABC transporter ATP-binding protein [Verrucomicrobiota bacterium]
MSGTDLREESFAEPVIEVSNLTKTFGVQKALDDICLSVPAGAIGLLGPNGAGKTTFMKCLLQLLPSDGGTARLLSRDLKKEGREIRKLVGYTPEEDCHVPGMVGCEYVTYCAQLCGLPFRAARQRAHEMLDFVGMGQERYRKVETYSTGMKQRLKLAQAIVHDPKIVFLDEPTNGLDPRGQVQVLDLIQSLWRRQGITVVLSSHLLHDVDRICDRIIVIARGRVLVHDRLEALKARRKGVVEVVMPDGAGDLVGACSERGWPAELLPNGRVRVEHEGESLNALLSLMRGRGLTPIELIPSPNALEEVFVKALEMSHESN